MTRKKDDLTKSPFSEKSRRQILAFDPQKNNLVPDDSDHQNRTLLEYVADRIHRYVSSRDLRRTGKRWRWSMNRLRSVMNFHPHDFDDDEEYARWLDEEFFPAVFRLRSEQGKRLAPLRENTGHLASWMEDYGVCDTIVSRFRKYIRASGRLWRDLVDEGCKRSDEKPRLSTADVASLLDTSEELLSKPSLLQNPQLTYSDGRNRVANHNHVINIHAAIRVSLIVTKRPGEIFNIKKADVSEESIGVQCSKVHRNGEMTEYPMWKEYWPSIKRLMDSHDKETLFAYNRTTMTSWIKALMVHCGFEHDWFNLHRMRSFSGDALAAGGADSLEMMAHGDWKTADSVQTYIGEQGRRSQVHSASAKKRQFMQKEGLLGESNSTEQDDLIDLIAGLNQWDDPPEWIPLFDELESQMVDVTRFELVASTMPR